MENVPDKVLSDLVLGNINMDFDFLALKIMLSRLRQRVKTDSGPIAVQSAVRELQSFFKKFGHLPNLQKDIVKILGSRRAS